jgi:hypothetical protein
MNAPFLLQLRFTIACGACGTLAVVLEARARAGDLLPVPSLPEGWCLVDGKPICPMHEVEVRWRAAASQARPGTRKIATAEIRWRPVVMPLRGPARESIELVALGRRSP